MEAIVILSVNDMLGSNSVELAMGSPFAIGYFDGSIGPVNPGGTGGWGFVLRDWSGASLGEGSGRVAPSLGLTSKTMEYVAAGMLLKTYMALKLPGPLLVRGDSRLVVMQMRGDWQVREGSYVETYHRVQGLLKKCAFAVQWEWVPHDQNMQADTLSKQVIKEVGISPLK